MDDYGHNLDGYGSAIYADGSRYTGQWQMNSPHGEGEMINQAGEMRKGTWDHGQFIGAKSIIEMD